VYDPKRDDGVGGGDSMSSGYQKQMLLLMVQGLVSDAPLRQRLRDVAYYLGPRIAGKFDDPQPIKGKLEGIYRRLSHGEAGPGDDGNIDATTKRLTDEEAKSIASDIVSLFFEACGGDGRT
jgi:hypothetical protein